jgi:hypothetical protein
MRYLAVAGTVLAFLLTGFLVAEAFDLPLLADPTPGSPAVACPARCSRSRC